LVRQWAIDLASREHAAGLTDLDVDSIVGLLHHADAAIQQFGAGLLERSNRLAALSVEDWRKLLTDGHFATLPAICAAMERHLAPDRLSLDECVELANARAAPVARLGLTWLRTRNVRSAADVAVVGRLAGAQCDALAHEVAGWALSIVGSPGNYDARTAASFFDSPLTEVRDAAWEWLIADSPGADDPALFVMLLETPYDDLRLRLIDRLAQRSALPGCGVDDLAPVWSAVLLGVVRGGRRKPKAVVQLAAAIATDPNRADALLPVLAAAVRSIRRPEALAALAAVVTLADGSPRLALEIASHLPELRLPQEEVA
jgi:hypothetical protein